MSGLYILEGIAVEKLRDNIPVETESRLVVKHGNAVITFSPTEINIVTRDNISHRITENGTIVHDDFIPLTGYANDVLLSIGDTPTFYGVIESHSNHRQASVGDTTSTGWHIDSINDTSVTVSQDLETHTLPFDTSASNMMTYGLYYDHYIFSKRDW